MNNTNDQELMEWIASDDILDAAFDWMCQRRKDYCHNNDVWDVRWRWDEIKPGLHTDLTAGKYRLSVQRLMHIDGETIELWSSLDALVLKAVSIVLTQYLKPYISDHCHHVIGNGGAKAAVCKAIRRLKGNAFVFRTDVKRYYASIDLTILFDQLRCYIDDPRLLALLHGYLHRTVYDGGHYRDIERGISLGCSLSPLMGALYLKELDDHVTKTGLFYARFMDDWIILAPSRWKLRGAVKMVNQTLTVLKLEKHPDKTFIGRISRGFDFLGYNFGPSGLNIARKTLMNFAERITRLYEQGADSKRVGQYIRHWLHWLTTFRQTMLPASRNFIRICIAIFLIRYLVFCAEQLLRV